MTDAYVTEILKNINDMTTGINDNSMITQTREAVINGIKSFQATPAEKAKLYANFEMQFSVQVVTKLIDSVLQAGLIEQQILLEKEKVKLAAQQLLTETQNTSKVTAEVALLQSNKLLVDAQKLTQEKQKLDVMAGINIKNEQALSTRESARFEEARRIVLLKSTEFNNQIQKAKEENALINSLAVDDSFVVSESHLTRSKTAMDNISVAALTYTSSLDTVSLPIGHVDA